MEKVTLSKSESFKIINPIYFKLERMLNSIHNGNFGKTYFDLIKAEEKEHRHFVYFDGVTYGLTISEAVKLFYVITLFEYLIEGRSLSVKDYLFVKKSHFFAESLALNYKDELTSCYNHFDFDKINQIDYADLMK